MTRRPAQKSAGGTRIEYYARVLLLAVLLAATWLLWSGFFTPLLMALGAFSSVLVVYLAHRMHLFDTDIFAIRLSLRLFRFWAWLAGEVARSSLEVTRLVLSPKLRISPTLVKFSTTCTHPVDRAILGNSITLTPGTLTLNIDGGNFLVHSLTRQGAEEIQAGEMDRRVAALRAD